MSIFSPVRERVAQQAVRAAESLIPGMRNAIHMGEEMGRPGVGALPVVIQGGLSTDGWMYMLAKRQLEARGFDVVLSRVNWHGWDTIEQDAQFLSKAVDHAKATFGVDRVSLVGHSKGGVIARWYLQELGGLENVSQLITLGTPHLPVTPARMRMMFSEGPLAARRAGEAFTGVLERMMAAIPEGIQPRGGRDLMTESDTMRRLNSSFADFMRRAAVERPDFRVTSISSSWHGLAGDGVVPRAASALEPAFPGVPGVRDIHVTGASGPSDHLRMISENRDLNRSLTSLLAERRR